MNIFQELTLLFLFLIILVYVAIFLREHYQSLNLFDVVFFIILVVLLNVTVVYFFVNIVT